MSSVQSSFIDYELKMSAAKIFNIEIYELNAFHTNIDKWACINSVRILFNFTTIKIEQKVLNSQTDALNREKNIMHLFMD